MINGNFIIHCFNLLLTLSNAPSEDYFGEHGDWRVEKQLKTSSLPSLEAATRDDHRLTNVCFYTGVPD